MTRLLHHHRPDEALIPVARRAPSWPRRADADEPISFADIAALEEPEWAGTVPGERFWPGRYAVGALVPAGQLAVVPLPDAPVADEPPTMPVVTDPWLLFDALDSLDQLPALHDTADEGAFRLAANVAAIQTYVALRPELADAHEVQMLLAPIVAQLAGLPTHTAKAVAL